jgi:hypothetical protein
MIQMFICKLSFMVGVGSAAMWRLGCGQTESQTNQQANDNYIASQTCCIFDAQKPSIFQLFKPLDPSNPHPQRHPATLPMDCTTFKTQASFESRVSRVENNTSLVTKCRAEVCGALWGTGNPDVSGIGMAIGYLLESCISLIVLCAFQWTEIWPPSNAKLAKMLLANTSRAFFDNAIFFTFAIQAASIATLTRVDFGISADGMGALTMQITWLVSMLTLLPLLPLVLRPKIYQKELRETSEGEGCLKSTPGSLSGRSSALRDARQDLRFLFFVICWAMAFCPFFSRMGGTFGKPSPISICISHSDHI